jgi:cytochrome c oxidase subunit 4
MSNTSHAHVPDHAHAHDEGIAKYIYVFLALCVLTGASFFTYSTYWPFHDQPKIGWAFMMAVSCTKAMLVILFFMHVKYEANWKYVLTIPAAFMSIFLILALVPDVGLRGHWLAEERELYMAEPRDPATLHHADSASGHDPEGPDSGVGRH